MRESGEIIRCKNLETIFVFFNIIAYTGAVGIEKCDYLIPTAPGSKNSVYFLKMILFPHLHHNADPNWHTIVTQYKKKSKKTLICLFYPKEHLP